MIFRRHHIFIFLGLLVFISITVYMWSKNIGTGSEKMETISETVKAVLYDDGSVRIQTGVALDERTKMSFKRRRRIDEQFPSKKPDSNSVLHSVKNVLSGDTVLLDDGTILRLAGIKCPHENDAGHKNYFTEHYHIRLTKVQEYVSLSKTYLSRYVEAKKISFIEHSKVDDGSIIGYLWLVDFSLINDPEMKGIITGPSYTCINETILTSGWGVADFKLQHMYSEKYTKLQKMAQKSQVGIWAKD